MDDSICQKAMKERILQQISEIEILVSVYPQKGEFELEDPETLSMWKKCLDKEESTEDAIKRGLSFILKLESLEIVAHMPLNYPCEYPDILVRSPELNKDGYSTMMSELKNFMEELADDINMPAIIGWLQENIEKYMKLVSSKNKTKAESRIACADVFSRLWIYSHHIYSSNKRKLIIQHAVNLDLTGFCMPGKPGIIVVEGVKCNVDKFWSLIHSLQWQKLAVKEREDFELCETEIENRNSNARFENFKECHFSTSQSHGTHADLGKLYQFLIEHGCGDVFQSLFGLEGRPPEDVKKPIKMC